MFTLKKISMPPPVTLSGGVIENLDKSFSKHDLRYRRSNVNTEPDSQ